jgi:hypothetical protein
MAKARPSRISGSKILSDLRLAGRKGDRSALAIALDSMRTLAHSPRYWERYLVLLRNPFARLVDLIVIKQGERIAHQKGWKNRRGAKPPSEASPRGRGQSPRSKRPRSTRRPQSSGSQPSLFD